MYDTGSAATFIATSLDGFTTQYAETNAIADTATRSYDLGSGFQSIVGSVTFRIYVWDSDGATAALGIRGGGNFDGVYDFAIYGTTSAIPEPSAFAALAGIFTLGLTGYRRRRV